MAHGNMNSISTPDLNNLTDKQAKDLNAFDRKNAMDGIVTKPKTDFAEATQHRDIVFTAHDPEKDMPLDGEQLYEEFTKTKRERAIAENTLDRGVKIKGTYVARRRLITLIVAACVLFVGALLFAPPIFSANDSEGGCRYEDIFARKGVTQYKSEVLSNYNVYNINAMSSDLSKSYRICTVSFNVRNLTPFTVKLGDYTVANGGDHKNNIVYSASVDKNTEVSAFSSKTVKVDILVNKEGLTDEEFDKAVTSLVLSTKGMKRRLFGSVELPTIPALMFVSDVVTFQP